MWRAPLDLSSYHRMRASQVDPHMAGAQIRSLIDLGIGPESLPKKLRRLANGQAATDPRAAPATQQQAGSSGSQRAVSGSMGSFPPPAFASAPDMASSVPSRQTGAATWCRAASQYMQVVGLLLVAIGSVLGCHPPLAHRDSTNATEDIPRTTRRRNQQYQIMKPPTFVGWFLHMFISCDAQPSALTAGLEDESMDDLNDEDGPLHLRYR